MKEELRAVHHACNVKEDGNMRMQKRASREGAFTLVEIMIVVAVIGLLAAIAVPNFVHTRSTAQKSTCINNLRQIDAAKEQWVLETGQAPNALPTSADIQPFLGRASAVGSLDSVVCPLDSTGTFATSYQIRAVDLTPLCRIGGTGGSIALDAEFLHELPN